MAVDPEKQGKPFLDFDPEFQSENIAFNPKEMLACDGCSRANPPNRLNCMYCGNELNIRIEDAALIKANRRKLELWECGFNVIVRKSTAEKPAIDKIAALLSLDASVITSILDLSTPLPIARVESENEAGIILNALATLGLRCSVIPDDGLSVDKLPVRLSKIDIIEGGFVLRDFNTGNVTIVAKDDLALIVPGLLTTDKIDSLEKKRRGKETKILAETITAEDEAILDIYSRSDSNGFRIRLAGFDFSCLGEKKGLLAAENLKALIHFLKERSPNAKLVSNYSAIKQVLGIVWEIESRKDSKGLQRVGFGKTEFGAVASTNNLNQFTKYSRLQWHLL
ncbi:MAG: hypothetical protein IPL32_04075 [Chloracidobacterium sp.]|nr:hypothetical protein [Chloracidobacterium sp.]